MVDLIRWLKRNSRTAGDSAVGEGYVYVSADDTNPVLGSMRPNTRVGGVSDSPPWIVVDHSPQSVILARWPGRLWKVQILRKASEQPLAYAAYTRATAVHVIEEVPLAALFVHNGPAVVGFLNRVSQLTAAQVAALGHEQDEEATHIHSLVWDRWLAEADVSSDLIGATHTGTIAIGSKAPHSPVGNAPSVLHTQLTNLALHLVGDEAFVTDDEEQYFTPTWATVAANLQHGLFAAGVQDRLLSPAERAVLSRVCVHALPRDDA
ncbi:MAG: hypothetical protein ACK5V0_02245 [Alphaproteobacteria bacterium]